MVYEQLYSPALALQRKRLNVGKEAKAAVICDAWTGTFKKTDGLALRRPGFFVTTPVWRAAGRWFNLALLVELFG